MPRQCFQEWFRRYRRRRLATFLGYGLNAAVLQVAAGVCWQWPPAVHLVVAACVLLALFASAIRALRLTSPRAFARHLNRVTLEVEDSAELLLMDEGRTLLEHLQAEKVTNVLASMPASRVRMLMPSQKRVLVGFLVTPVAAGMLLGLSDLGPADTPSDSVAPARLVSVNVALKPPPYTGVQPSEQTNLDVVIEENGNVEWLLKFDRPITEVGLELDGSEPLRPAVATGSGREITLNHQAQRNAVYRIVWQDGREVQSSELAAIRLRRDQPPTLRVVNLGDSPMEVSEKEGWEIEFAVVIADDYGLESAKVSVTTASGDGEAVQFRDHQIDFEEVHMNDSGDSVFRHVFRADDLALTPGDEFYFQAIARDRREPSANVSKTPMFIVRWSDGKTSVEPSMGGFPLDIQPGHLRSQRQIIADTETLAQDAAGSDRAEFTRRARELAFDQRALRLRYGQHLGEEFEASIGAGPGHAEEHGGNDLDSLNAVDGGDHPTVEKGAHMEAPDRGQEQEQEHEHEVERVSGSEGFLPGQRAVVPGEYVHAHDSSEHATLFADNVRATLKAALSSMWQAELQLHLAHPREALSHEYEALRNLKSVQQASRIYVKRAGFEAPPLNEDKRLSGELEDVRSYVSATEDEGAPSGDVDFATLYRLLEKPLNLGNDEARNELIRWRKALSADDADLSLRTTINRALDLDEDCEACRVRLQQAAWARMPSPPAMAERNALSKVGTRYLRRVGQLSH